MITSNSRYRGNMNGNYYGVADTDGIAKFDVAFDFLLDTEAADW
jgi:hypothetical protein